MLEPRKDYGHRLVIDLNREEDNQEKRAKRALEKTDESEYLVAVDAGHGGEDPGAIGPNGVQEKRVVLEIAKRVAEQINRREGMRAFLTRDGDYFLQLRERIQKARQAKADLFLSIHADAFRENSAKGASVYALSRRGASDEAARYLAERENRSDLAGGVELEEVDQSVAPVVLDLVQTATIQDSLSLGQRILSEMGDVTTLHFDEVHQARFVVLKSPDIPSVLVETGFISNPTEARRLQQADYQKRLARSVAAGSARFLEERDPVPARARIDNASQAGRSGNEGGASSTYTVSRGDTLWSIAERHQVSVPKLRRVNNLAGNNIEVGRTLQIP
jgi:N-acetylmuramoyl-L-alanine amidase